MKVMILSGFMEAVSELRLVRLKSRARFELIAQSNESAVEIIAIKIAQANMLVKKGLVSLSTVCNRML